MIDDDWIASPTQYCQKYIHKIQLKTMPAFAPLKNDLILRVARGAAQVDCHCNDSR